MLITDGKGQFRGVALEIWNPKGDIEKYYRNDRPTLYASTVYWYLAPGGVDPYGTVPVKERTLTADLESIK